jgi:pilus assembly protein FimV
MQQFTSITLLRALACAVLLAPARPAVHAAELGDVAVRSFIGQPLAADIELVALAPDELNALQVKLAQADVFRGANITMNPALSSVRMAVVKRDQKQFLHVTTTRPITAEYVHLYLELSAAGRHDVRLATVWLQADPNPPAPPAPLATAAGGAGSVGSANAASNANAASASVAGSAGAAGAAGAADPAQLAAQARAERVSSVAVAAGAAARDR